MSTDFGNGLEFQVDRELLADETALDAVVFQKRKPPLAEEFNFFQDLQSLNRRKALKAQLKSGIIDFTLEGEVNDILPTRSLVLDGLTAPNQFAMQNFRALVDGMLVDVVASRVNGASVTSSALANKFNVVKLNAPPEDGQSRVDLVFLEVWRAPIGTSPNTVNKPSATTLYRNGNKQFVGTQLADQMIDPSFNIETTKRIQVQYQIRVVEGVTLDGFLGGSPEGNPDGISQSTKVKARAGSVGGADTVYTFSSRWTSGDSGLYRAGDGSTAAKQALKSYDGYSYAIPLIAVSRRTKDLTNGYTKSLPNSCKTSLSDGVPSDRPDGLFFDEVAIRDIIDLRHRVLVSNPDFSQILKKSFRKLCAGTLRTKLNATENGGLAKGVELMDVDTIGSPSETSSSIATPDGFRRVFSNQPTEQSLVGSFTYNGSTQATGVVHFYPTSGPLGADKKILVDSNNLDAVVVFDAEDRETWPTVLVNGSPVDLNDEPGDDGWLFESGTLSKAYIILTVADQVLFPPNATVEVQFSTRYPGRGFRFVPETVHTVQNVNPDLVSDFPSTYAFTVDNRQRSVDVDQYIKLARPGSPTTDHSGDTLDDYVVDFPVTGDSLKGATRVRSYFVNGTALVNYTIPATVDGQRVVGILKIAETANAGATFTELNMADNLSAINKGIADGSDWTVTLGLPVGQASFVGWVLRFDLVLANISASVSSHSRGVLDFAKDDILVIPSVSDSNTTQEFTTLNNELILALPKYVAPNGTEYFYGFVQGLMRQVTITEANDGIVAGIGTNKIIVQFSGTINPLEKLELAVLSTATPTVDDLIDFAYTYHPYQGYGSIVPLDDCEVLAINEGLVHTLGTGKAKPEADPSVVSLAQHLPLPHNTTEAVLESATFSLAADATDLRSPALEFAGSKSTMCSFELLNKFNPDVHAGVLPKVGDIVKISSLPSGTVNPERGIADKKLSVVFDADGESYVVEFNTPYLSSKVVHQAVWSALVLHQKTGEILMLVLTKMVGADTFGNKRVVGEPSSTVAFDVFRVDHRPLVTV